MHILVATPAYGCMVHIDYMHSVNNLCVMAEKAGVKVTIMTIGNNSLITEARNCLISYFVANKDLTHMLFLDADIAIPDFCVPRLVSRNVDIIGVPIPMKAFGPDYSPIITIGDIYSIDETGLAEVEHINTACMLVSKKAAMDACMASEKYSKSVNRGVQLDMVQYDVFKCGSFNGRYVPEDFYFCYKMRDLGYRIYADLTIPIKHCGMYEFHTNEEFLSGIINAFKYKDSIDIHSKDRLN